MKTIEELEAENERLKAQIEIHQSGIQRSEKYLIDEVSELRQQLAESQAREKKRFELMRQHMRFWINGNGYLEEALTIPSDDTTLREYVEKEVAEVKADAAETIYLESIR